MQTAKFVEIYSMTIEHLYAAVAQTLISSVYRTLNKMLFSVNLNEWKSYRVCFLNTMEFN